MSGGRRQAGRREKRRTRARRASALLVTVLVACGGAVDSTGSADGGSVPSVEVGEQACVAACNNPVRKPVCGDFDASVTDAPTGHDFLFAFPNSPDDCVRGCLAERRVEVSMGCLNTYDALNRCIATDAILFDCTTSDSFDIHLIKGCSKDRETFESCMDAAKENQ